MSFIKARIQPKSHMGIETHEQSERNTDGDLSNKNTAAEHAWWWRFSGNHGDFTTSWFDKHKDYFLAINMKIDKTWVMDLTTKTRDFSSMFLIKTVRT